MPVSPEPKILMKSRKTGIQKLLYQKETGIIPTGVIISGDNSIKIIIGSFSLRPDSKYPFVFRFEDVPGVFPPPLWHPLP